MDRAPPRSSTPKPWAPQALGGGGRSPSLPRVAICPVWAWARPEIGVRAGGRDRCGPPEQTHDLRPLCRGLSSVCARNCRDERPAGCRLDEPRQLSFSDSSYARAEVADPSGQRQEPKRFAGSTACALQDVTRLAPATGLRPGSGIQRHQGRMAQREVRLRLQAPAGKVVRPALEIAVMLGHDMPKRRVAQRPARLGSSSRARRAALAAPVPSPCGVASRRRRSP